MRKLIATVLRRARADAPAASDAPLAALAGHPLQALLALRNESPLPFACPVDGIVMLNALGFSPASWHPFSAALEEWRRAHGAYEGSVLQRFYATWTPRHADRAVVGFDRMPAAFATLPSHAYHVSPWSLQTAQATLDQLQAFYAADYKEHGCPDLNLQRDGFKYHGPVSQALGECEYRRLLAIHDAMASVGYDRTHGEINVYMLRRGSELRFVCRGGVHRVAAAAALGHPTIPARLCRPYLVDAMEAAFWPAVLNGTWSPGQAMDYFDHLFDFDARRWAQQQGLAPAA